MTNPSHPQAAESPSQTLLVRINGKTFVLSYDEYTQKPLPDPGGAAMIDQLASLGTYLAFIPPDLAVGFGEVCTLVNLDAILTGAGAPSGSRVAAPRLGSAPHAHPHAGGHPREAHETGETKKAHR